MYGGSKIEKKIVEGVWGRVKGRGDRPWATHKNGIALTEKLKEVSHLSWYHSYCTYQQYNTR